MKYIIPLGYPTYLGQIKIYEAKDIFLIVNLVRREKIDEFSFVEDSIMHSFHLIKNHNFLKGLSFRDTYENSNRCRNKI